MIKLLSKFKLHPHKVGEHVRATLSVQKRDEKEPLYSGTIILLEPEWEEFSALIAMSIDIEPMIEGEPV